MPNWTTNVLAMRKCDMNRIVDAQGWIDFNKIRPMPKDLSITCGGVQREAIAAAKARRNGDERALAAIAEQARLPHQPIDPLSRDMVCRTAGDLADLGERYLANEDRYEALTWYEWRIANWGTKWNAVTHRLDYEGEYAVAVFDTAWDRPSSEMLLELAARCSSGIWHEWAHEDYNGICAERIDPDGSLRAATPIVLCECLWEDGDDSYRYAEPSDDWAANDLVFAILGQQAAV